MGVHEIPLLPPDQPRVVSVNNCVDVVLALQAAIDDTFKTINERIQSK